MKLDPFYPPPSDQIFPDDAKQHLDAGVLLIDVREPDEFAQARIPGAVLIPMSELNQRADEISRDREVIIYCRSGNRSRQVVDAFRQQRGYTNLLNLEGGIIAWYDRGHPVDTQPVEASYQTSLYEELDVIKAKNRLASNRSLLVDVREPDEFTAGHLPDAVNFPLNTLPAHLDELREASAVLLVCNTGNRSAIAANWLIQQGLTAVTNIEGGTVAWIQNGFTIER
ncbi:MAG: rhodanese-like domain-containing protein [Chloroflexi bacterium]|nr:rhodanese-like domain-containing protein [Chloroflexota bacterium]